MLKKAVIGRIKNIKLKSPAANIVVDAAVLIEMGILGYVDKLLVVKIDKDKQLARAGLKWSLSKGQIENRIKLQMPPERLVKSADFVINNSGSLKQAKIQARVVWDALVKC